MKAVRYCKIRIGMSEWEAQCMPWSVQFREIPRSPKRATAHEELCPDCSFGENSVACVGLSSECWRKDVRGSRMFKFP